MSQLIEVRVPDIGDFDAVPVIELFVKAGDSIAAEEAICTLESDKATMDVPATHSGIIEEICVAVGDKVAEGTLLLRIAVADDAEAPVSAPLGGQALAAVAQAPAPATTDAPAITHTVSVPDIGDFSKVPVIEILVSIGDEVTLEQPIVTLESDKATMDVPASSNGIVTKICVAIGDKVSQGDAIIELQSQQAPANTPTTATRTSTAVEPTHKTTTTATFPPAPQTASAASHITSSQPSAIVLGGAVHASPSVRSFARSLGVDLAKVRGTGPKQRILKEDVSAFVKTALTQPAAATNTAPPLSEGLNLLPWPTVDFSKFGETETQPLSRIQKISAQNLARNWVVIPAVTYHEDSDITDLENFRVRINQENEKQGRKLTMLAFIIKASVKALQTYPQFNTSLDLQNGEMSLVYKKYYNIGFAADTPHGLVVPVIKNADQKSVFDIAAETAALAKKARDGKLGPADMAGACFTISSLGGIGGTAFSPIINAPEVAILGVNKSVMKPVWKDSAFVPRLILPLSLSADHRVIDGALATRFNAYIAELLADFRRVVL